ncbi:ribosome-binding factor A [Agrilactobacillus composti DSM 18527 = JCM 14202]|jgi:ribosome-binding factor A|uniref:Ribosome-binding factor A n=1 Tax=Agrilactobacillus composti DSM 18527 = JCM 14202 TaxID=1423734 RepID=X0PGY3_9LACO|nr:30S ribosome-binding factor RbfA [Agrilactobacillus composti]KRM36848.1 ribosome-binding factor A [Agrilactobacillus composti DSM 18527 = JCM 14202]MCH4170498.1 30S ribosome-binding factor RbfA [Lactobacillus sp.]GAF41208.1 ribosome-binding factor A [Agrilactobacillus composti DSM 18527 = JCM 14202]
MKHRIGRVEQEILREVNDILLKRVRDPRIEGVTITGVDLTGDLQHCKIYYSILSDKASDSQRAQAGLDHAKGLIRSELGQRIKIYKIPELTFLQDKSVQYGERIDELIRGLHESEKQ